MNIALSGSGDLSSSEIGVLSVLEEKLGKNFKINKMVGSSGGALIGGLYVIGYRSEELFNLYLTINFETLAKGKDYKYINLIFNKGEYEGTSLVEELDKLIEIKTGIKNCTFGDLPDVNLTLITNNINKKKVLEMNRENTPNLPISKAMRMSFATPIIFTPVLYEGDYYVDGGCTLYYPFGLLPEENRIGIFVRTSYYEAKSVNSYYEYIKALVLLSMDDVEYPDTIYVNFTETMMSLTLNKEQLNNTYKMGVEAAKEYYKKNPKEYKI